MQKKKVDETKIMHVPSFQGRYNYSKHGTYCCMWESVDW